MNIGRAQGVQGDVLVTPVDKLPAGANRLDHRVAAYGEATGHHHEFDTGVLFETDDGKMWVVAEEETTLTHQEHGPITFAPGIYEVSKQIEADPFTGVARRVQD